MAVDWDALVIGPNVAIFGDQVRIRNGEFTQETTGVFDQAYLELAPLGRGGNGVEEFSLGLPGAISEARPVLGVQISALAWRPKQSDTLEILTGAYAGRRYQIKEVRPDSHGHALLLLNDYAGL